MLFGWKFILIFAKSIGDAPTAGPCSQIRLRVVMSKLSHMWQCGAFLRPYLSTARRSSPGGARGFHSGMLAFITRWWSLMKRDTTQKEAPLAVYLMGGYSCGAWGAESANACDIKS